MTNENKLKLIEEVINMIDSFQQDYGQFKYSFTISSYANGHQILCHIAGENRRIDFVVDETYESAIYANEALFDLFKKKSHELLLL